MEWEALHLGREWLGWVRTCEIQVSNSWSVGETRQKMTWWLQGHEGQGRHSKEERLMEMILKRGASDEGGRGGTEDFSFLSKWESRC